MANGNTVSIVGNVTRDPELRFTKSGVAVVSFGVAYNNRRFNKQTNEYDEEVSFFDVTAWQSLAENIAESLHKGDRVVIEGRLEQQSWETTEGDKRTKVEIVADEVAPSLRWAKAAIERNERPGARSEEQPPTPAGAAEYVSPDEEPF